MSLREAAIAANRFGLGARPGELEEIAHDPRGWLEAQIGPASPPTPAPLAALPSSRERVRDARVERMASREDAAAQRALRREIRRAHLDEMARRAQVAATTDQPFRERLVRFWSNHFCVSTARNEVRLVAGAFEREAIRPWVCAPFRQLLLAAERHPAMQLYLDNARSIGPDSLAGQRSGRGLNENHAREILELHTLGVDGGYTQADVENFAAILTGWGLQRGRTAISGGFAFDERRHQPGRKTLLGKTYHEAGEAEGRAALDDLARHPSTARHLAAKLVRHFVADDPPAAAVDRIARTFEATGGDLAAVHRELVALPEAWEADLPKLKTPAELVDSTARALGYTDGESMVASYRYLGQEPFAAPSPQGWPDVAAEWLGPEAVLDRVEWALNVGVEAAYRADPAALADAVLGPTLSARTRQAIARAPDPTEGLGLLLASPEFQRR